MEFIVKRGAGFIYYLSRDGVPGMRMQDAVGANLAQPVDRIRAHASLPVAVGLGISNPEQAKLVAESADAVVIGNAVVNQIAKHGKSENWVHNVAKFVGKIAQATRL